MEADNVTSSNSKQFKDLKILQLSNQKKAERLWEVFNQKILDIFIRDCQILIKEGFDLSTLSKLKQYPNDFKIEYESMKKVLDISKQYIELSLSSDEGWNVIDIDDKCYVSIRVNKSVVDIKAKGTIDLNIKHIAYVAYLIKFYTHCIPFCKEAKDLLQPSRIQKIGFIRLSFPIPFIKDRSTLARGVGFRLSHLPQKIYIFAQGINNDEQYLKRVKIDPKVYMAGRQILDIKYATLEVECLGPKQIKFCAAATLDHHISLAPKKLLVFIIKQVSKFILVHLFQKLRNFEQTVWAKELKQNYNENKQFYQWIDRIIDHVILAAHQQPK